MLENPAANHGTNEERQAPSSAKDTLVQAAQRYGGESATTPVRPPRRQSRQGPHDHVRAVEDQAGGDGCQPNLRPERERLRPGAMKRGQRTLSADRDIDQHDQGAVERNRQAILSGRSLSPACPGQGNIALHVR